MKSWRRHVLGFAVVAAVALAFLTFLARRSERDLPLVYAGMTLVPLLPWAMPGLVRGLARGMLRAHRTISGKAAFYLRLPREGEPRFTQTALMALGPFAVDLLVMAELLYLGDPSAARALRSPLVAFPILFALAGFLTSLPAGMWLLDALDLRVVNPARGTVARVAEFFERVLGPASAVFALASFVALLHTVGYSYEEGILLLGLWTARLFPAVLATTIVYRILVEPRVIPSVRRWCDDTGIVRVDSLAPVLGSLAGRANAATEAGGVPAQPRGNLLSPVTSPLRKS